MSLNPITIQYAEFIEFVECSICGNRFSKSMIHAWPLCEKGLPHKTMSSEDQKTLSKEAQGSQDPLAEGDSHG